MAYTSSVALNAIGFSQNPTVLAGPRYARLVVVDVHDGTQALAVIMHRPLSHSLLASAVLQSDPEVLQRFIVFPAIMSAIYGPINPRTPFRVAPELYGHIPTYDLLRYTQGFRRELMTVLTDLLLVTDDAIFRSFIEHRPLRFYKSRAKFDQASRLYPAGTTPYDELIQVTQYCSPKWVTIVRGLV